MTERKQTPEPWTYNYNNPYEKEGKKDSRWSKVKRGLGKAVVAATALGVFGGAAYGIEQSVNADSAEKVKMMNEKFEPILAPVAQDVAKFVIDKSHQYEGKQDKKNRVISYDASGKKKIDFTTDSNGTEYRVEVVVDKDAQGNPDPTKVSRADIWEMSDRASNPSGIVRKYDIEAPGANDEGYWGGSMTTDYPGEPTGLKSRLTYNYGGPYDSLEDDVEFSKTINKRVHEQLDEIEKVSQN